MNSRNEITYLTGLRGMAVLLVLFAHIIPGHSYNKAIAYLGMSLFFMLSGIVITYVWSKKFLSAKKSVAEFVQIFFTFIWSRFARLAPLYLLAGIPYYASSSKSWEEIAPLLPRYLLGIQSWSYDAIANVQNIIEIKQIMVYGISWSISAELFLYLCFPLILLTLLQRNIKFSWGLAIATYIIYCLTLIYLAAIKTYSGQGYPPSQTYIDWFVYLSPYGRLIEFMIGMLIGHTLANPSNTNTQQSTRSYHGIFALCIITMIIIYLSINEANDRTSSTLALLRMGPIFTLPVCYLMISLARRNDITEKIFNFQPLVNIGVLSYSMYLLQHYGIPSFGTVWKPGISEIIRNITNFGVIILLSSASYRLIEAPCRRFLLNHNPITKFIPALKVSEQRI